MEGRQTDFLVTPDGRVMHALSVIYILRDTPAIEEFKVIQDTVEHVTVQMVTRQPLTSSEEATLRAQFTSLLGPGVDLTLSRLEALPRSPSGKFRYVESRVASEILDRRMVRTA